MLRLLAQKFPSTASLICFILAPEISHSSFFPQSKVVYLTGQVLMIIGSFPKS